MSSLLSGLLCHKVHTIWHTIPPFTCDSVEFYLSLLLLDHNKEPPAKCVTRKLHSAKSHSSLILGRCQAQILQTPIFCHIQDQLNCYVSTEQSNPHTNMLVNQTLVKCFSFLQVSGFWATLGLWQHTCPQAPPRMVDAGAKHSLV